MRWPVRDHSLLKVCSVLTFSKTSTFKTDMFVRFQYFQNYLFSKLICLFVLTFSKTAIFKTDLFARFWHFPKHHFSKLISPPCPFRVGHVFRKRRPYRFLYEPHTSQMIHWLIMIALRTKRFWIYAQTIMQLYKQRWGRHADKKQP